MRGKQPGWMGKERGEGGYGGGGVIKTVGSNGCRMEGIKLG